MGPLSLEVGCLSVGPLSLEVGCLSMFDCDLMTECLYLGSLWLGGRFDVSG